MSSVLLTRRIPSSVLCQLTAHHTVDLYSGEGAIPRADLLARVREKDALMCLLTDRVDAEVMDAAPSLKIIANIAVGYENVDVPAARSRGIVVTNTPDVLTEAVAEFTWALILAVARRVAEGDRVVRANMWDGWGLDFMLGTELRGKQLGIVGAGRIGRAVAAKAPAFGMRVVATDNTATLATDHTAQRATDNTDHAAQRATDNTDHTAQRATDDTDHTAQRATDNTDHTAQRATDNTDHTAQRATDNTDHTAQRATDNTDRTAQRATDNTDHTAQKATDNVDQKATDNTDITDLVSLDQLLVTSDVVSIHVPLTPETRHLIDKRALVRMKRSALLVNTSRGPVVDEEALAWALGERLIAGAALDVYEHEPKVTPELKSFDNVVLAPHIGSATRETRTAMAELAVRNVLAVLAGKPPLTPIP